MTLQETTYLYARDTRTAYEQTQWAVMAENYQAMQAFMKGVAARFTQRTSPVLLDVAGFVAVTIGVWLLAGEWVWIAAGGLLILAEEHRQAARDLLLTLIEAGP